MSIRIRALQASLNPEPKPHKAHHLKAREHDRWWAHRSTPRVGAFTTLNQQRRQRGFGCLCHGITHRRGHVQLGRLDARAVESNTSV